jgi:hypothetical protein
MANWKDKYKVVGVKPGKIHTKQFGQLDFSRDDIPVKTCDKLVEDNFPYLKPIKQSPKKPSTDK